MSQRFLLGENVRLVGMSPKGFVSGVSVSRNGVVTYQISGVVGLWPSWLLESA